jgi:N-acetylmuramoyl-L-alanine amidase
MANGLPTVIIDPGHGGSVTVGGSSPNNASGGGLVEKDLTLEIGQMVAQRLAGTAEVLMTRTTDTNLGLADRARIARDHAASLFLAIHFNGFKDPTVDGTEVWVARNANAQSRAFAQTVLDQLLAVTQVANRGVKESDFGVLLTNRHQPETAACLAEIAFLSNPAEARRLHDADYKSNIAQTLAEAVLRHIPVSVSQSYGYTQNGARTAGGRSARRPVANASSWGRPAGAAYAMSIVGTGQAEIDCPLLASHGPASPNLVLRWNIPPQNRELVDVLVHFHGYSPAQNVRIVDKAQVSGVDFFSPTLPGPDNDPARVRPTLAIIPRGMNGGWSDDAKAFRYRFPALPNSQAVEQLIRFSLDWFATQQLQQPAGSLNRQRLLLTAHSGGGAALLAVLEHHDRYDPDEVHLFDSLYQPATAVRDWAIARIGRDAAELAQRDPAAWRDYMAGQGAALRTLFTAGKTTTPRNTELSDAVMCAILAISDSSVRDFLRAWYRVERTGVAHPDIPQTFGWQLLADASADVQPAPTQVADPQHCPTPPAAGAQTVSAWGRTARAFDAGSLTPEEADDAESPDDELLQSQPRAESQGGARTLAAILSRPALGQADARWAADDVSPDYHHLATGGVSQAFTFTGDVLARLCQLNRFDLEGGQPDRILFGLRGCTLVEGTASGPVAAVQLSEDMPDHTNARCIIGVWNRTTGQVAVFLASTVPNWRLMEGYRQGGDAANLLATGRYIYRVGTHRPSKPTRIPGAFIQQGPVVVLRTLDDLIYTITDKWDSGHVGDNIHAARLDGSSGPQFSSAGCQTVPGDYRSDQHVRAWGDFRAAAGLSASSPASENGRPFVYILLTGREARMVADQPNITGLARLRFGSSGSEVQQIQQALQSAGYHSGAVNAVMDAATTMAYIHWQQANYSGAADAIVSQNDAANLGFNF